MTKKSPALSPRLQKIADMILPCRCMADIGTDHAYLPVWLCSQGRCNTAIASDLSPGPLGRAEATVCRYGLKDRISLRLGSGAEPLVPGEADVIVIAGMGGLLIAELLKAKPQVFAAAKQILLQPMSSIPELRETLYQNGYTIDKEVLVREEEKLYHILSVLPCPESEPMKQKDWYLGRCLLRAGSEHLTEYLTAKKHQLEKKIAGLKQARTAIDSQELQDLSALLQTIQKLEEKEGGRPC